MFRENHPCKLIIILKFFIKRALFCIIFSFSHLFNSKPNNKHYSLNLHYSFLKLAVGNKQFTILEFKICNSHN